MIFVVNIVLCGSMKVKDKILKVKDELEDRGYKVLLPIECLEGKSKEIASKAHLDRIINGLNEVVLIVNEERMGIQNYIGPNTFAEIAFGYYYGKKVYLLNDIYEPFRDELEGWGVITLKGDLDNIKE